MDFNKYLKELLNFSLFHKKPSKTTKTNLRKPVLLFYIICGGTVKNHKNSFQILQSQKNISPSKSQWFTRYVNVDGRKKDTLQGFDSMQTKCIFSWPFPAQTLLLISFLSLFCPTMFNLR